MERKKTYETPSSTVVGVKYEGIVCTSPGYNPNFNKPFYDEVEF